MWEKRREEAEERRKTLLKAMTPTERRFKATLDKLGIRSYPQVIFFLDQNHYRIVDFYLPKPYRLCIELDGSSHDSQEMKSYDKWKDEKLTTLKRRYRIIRIRNSQVWHPHFKERLLERLKRYRIRPHHGPVRPKYKAEKPNTQPIKKPKIQGGLINMAWQVVKHCRRAEKNRFQGLEMQPGYTLAELKKMGIL